MNLSRISFFRNFLFLFFIFFSTVIQTSVFAQKVSIGEIPKWIKPHQPDLSYKLSTDEISGGFYYLLVDKQENIGLQSSYARYVINITNSHGVQNMSDISTEFDPKYQKLSFNQIYILRDGQRIDKLLTHKVNTVQRERDMDRFTLDGRLTAYLNLTDVRPGDIVDYSYTITGYNPINEGHFFKEYYFEFSLPVHQQFVRLLVPDWFKLNFKYNGEKLNPEVSKGTAGTEYEWKAQNVKATQYEDDTPDWFDPARKVSITDFSAWKDVVEWILKDYTVSEAEKSKIKKMMAGILKSNNIDNQITEAVRFVQDNIRYLGLESGLNAYVPNPPTKVLQRRYGDCKDKSMLLCAILQSQGIDALPVLVNSNGLPDETILQPSPGEFNHCIVQVFHNDKYWYVDPTYSYQGNNADSSYVPEYGEGLVLRKGTEGTTKITGNAGMDIKVLSKYASDSLGGNAVFTVHTTYYGGQADINRLYFASNSLDEISQSYLDFYDGTYPEIRASEKIIYKDDREKNIFSVDETYLINNFWEKSKENPKKITSYYYPFTLRSTLKVPTSSERKMPFKLAFPTHIVEQIEINLPESWQVKPNSILVNDPAYFFTYTSSSVGSKIRLYYEYKSLSDHVEPLNTGEFAKGMNKILDDESGYQLIYDTTAAKPFNFSWLMGIIALVVLLIFTFFAFRVYSRYDLPTQSDTFMSSEIGGWLVLIAIGLVISPFSVLYYLFVSSTFFDTKTIEIILNQNTSDSISWTLLVIFELIYNVFTFVFVGLLIILFFKRRTILPRLIVAFYALSFIVNAADFILAKQIINSGIEDGITAKTVFRSFLTASIWIPYFLISKRVKRTFTVQLKLFPIHTDTDSGTNNLTENLIGKEEIFERNDSLVDDLYLKKDTPLDDQ